MRIRNVTIRKFSPERGSQVNFYLTKALKNTYTEKESQQVLNGYEFKIIVEDETLDSLSSELGYEVTQENLPQAFLEWINENR